MNRYLITALKILANDEIDAKSRGEIDYMQPSSFYKDKHGLVWYADFHDGHFSPDTGDAQLSPKIIQDLKPYRMRNKQKLYRGLYFADEELLNEFLKGSKLNDKVSYRCINNFESWTTDYQLAEDWAKDTDYNVVLEAEFTPQQTIIDTDELPPEFSEALKYGEQEQEVIVSPCPKNAKIIFLTEGR